MIWAVTGGTGLVGRALVADLRARGEAVVLLGRRAPSPGGAGFRAFDLDRPETADLSGCDALIHSAFDHVPGRYRGGEGADPDGFRRRNLDGSLALFARAKAQGVARAVFLSSRAVYGPQPVTPLTETMRPAPDTLYGQVKWEVEQGLADLAGPGFATTSLRATGVWAPPAPGQRHKWTDLFADFLAGRPVEPRVATEVSGADLAQGLWLAAAEPGAGTWNVSDLVLDRHDLLAALAAHLGVERPLPPRADAARVAAMACDRLGALGWTPSGWTALLQAMPALAATARESA